MYGGYRWPSSMVERDWLFLMMVAFFVGVITSGIGTAILCRAAGWVGDRRAERRKTHEHLRNRERAASKPGDEAGD